MHEPIQETIPVNLLEPNRIDELPVVHLPEFDTADSIQNPAATYDQLLADDVCKEYDELCAEKSSYAAQSSQLDDKIELERSRLDEMVDGVARQRAESAVASARLLADRKHQVFEAQVRTQQAELESKILAVTEKQTAYDGLLYVIAETYGALRDQENAQVEIEVAKTEERGELAHIADQTPNLHERLHKFKSEHGHVYGDIETAGDAIERLLESPDEERSDVDQTLLNQVRYVLPKFIPDLLDQDKAIRTQHPLLRVYSGKELHELQKRLRAFSPKARADFSGLEARVLQAATVAFSGPEMEVPEDLEAAIERMHEDRDGRTGMVWSKLLKNTGLASDAIQRSLSRGSSKNLYRKDYLFTACDMTGTEPNLTGVYQFIADEFALDVIGQRKTAASGDIRQRFSDNCEIIKAWREEVDELFAQIPRDVRVQLLPRQKKNYRRRQQKPKTIPAVFAVDTMIRKIEIRRDGTGNPRNPNEKPFDLNPSGAFRNQLALGHLVNNLKDALVHYRAGSSVETNVEVTLDDLL